MKNKKMVKNGKCSRIKDIEKKLLCLKEKYDELTKRLEQEQEISTSDEGALDYQNVFEERRILEKYMQRLEIKLRKEEKRKTKDKKNDIVEQGDIVCLKNQNVQLKFRLVDEIYSQEENQISLKSPMGAALAGRRVGETVKVKTPNGKTSYEIIGVE